MRASEIQKKWIEIYVCKSPACSAHRLQITKTTMRVFSCNTNNNNNKSSYQHANIMYTASYRISIFSCEFSSIFLLVGANQWLRLKYGIEWTPFRAYNHRYRVYGSIYWSDILFLSIFSLFHFASIPRFVSVEDSMMKRAFHSFSMCLTLIVRAEGIGTFQPKTETYGLKTSNI